MPSLGEADLYRGRSAQDDRVFANAYHVKNLIMSFTDDEGHGAFDRTEPLPLASPTMVSRRLFERRGSLGSRACARQPHLAAHRQASSAVDVTEMRHQHGVST